MTEEIVAGMVRSWAAEVCPDDPHAAGRAAGVALRCYAAGASVGEACREARGFVRAWMLHPSHRRTHDVRIAS